MEHDPVRVANTRQWHLLAVEDLSNAGHDLEASPPFLRSALFHCQQSAEKALKGFLTWHDVPFRKVHDLEELGAICVQLDSALGRFMESVEPLTKYASAAPSPSCSPSIPTRRSSTPPPTASAARERRSWNQRDDEVIE